MEIGQLSAPSLSASLLQSGPGLSNRSPDVVALLSATNDPGNAPLSPAQGHANARATAEDFESVFLNTMLSQMFAGIETPEPFGGGHAEETYRGLMIEEYAKAITQSGGIGIADAIERQLIELQEAASK